MIRTVTVDLSQDGDAVLAEYRRKTFGPYEIRCQIGSAVDAMKRFAEVCRELQEAGVIPVYYPAEEG